MASMMSLGMNRILCTWSFANQLVFLSLLPQLSSIWSARITLTSVKFFSCYVCRLTVEDSNGTGERTKTRMESIIGSVQNSLPSFVRPAVITRFFLSLSMQPTSSQPNHSKFRKFLVLPLVSFGPAGTWLSPPSTRVYSPLSSARYTVMMML